MRILQKSAMRAWIHFKKLVLLSKRQAFCEHGNELPGSIKRVSTPKTMHCGISLLSYTPLPHCHKLSLSHTQFAPLTLRNSASLH